MGAQVEVEVTDSGATGLEQRLRGLAQSVTIGLQEDAEPYPDGTSVIEVGAAQEFGTKDIPARSFERSYVDGKGQLELGDAAQVQVGRVVDGEAPESIGRVLGEVGVAGMRAGIEAGIDPALAAATLANPDRDQRGIPLLDTGHLINSIAAKQEAE